MTTHMSPESSFGFVSQRAQFRISFLVLLSCFCLLFGLVFCIFFFPFSVPRLTMHDGILEFSG
jgi:hypothetical protein